MPLNYSISSAPALIDETFNVDVTEAFQPRYNACPTQLLPVITSDNPDGLSFFYWGTTPAFAKGKRVSDKLTMAPVEQIPDRPALRRYIRTQRCAIIADGFYDWKTLSKKGRTPYRFFLPDNEPFAIAGLWDSFDNDQGETIHTFMMITTPANKEVADITARMPAILEKDLIIEWLNDSNTEESTISLLKPYSEKILDRYTVNPKLGDSNFDTPELLKNVPPADQFGNFTLFG
ncbi:MAG: SOS response-associated peptidase [Roseivirga sp.]|nr:SOS response-associated peptidase [Roseivirga sp.]